MERIWNLRDQGITSQTASGEIVRISPGKDSPWDWESKYLTSDCCLCPHFILPEEAQEILEAVRLCQGKAKITFPDNPRGICVVGHTSYGRTVKKFLVENPHPLRCCTLPYLKREGRALRKRASGEFTSSLK